MSDKHLPTCNYRDSNACVCGATQSSIISELRTQLQAANERIERLKTHLSKFGDAWTDYQNEELEKETT